MQRIFLLGLNHTTAPLEVREKVALNSEQALAAVSAFIGKFNNCEIVVLSTCNRLEFYTALPDEAHGDGQQQWVEQVVGFLADFRQVPAEVFAPCLYQKTGEAAAEHLFTVASSLDSMVLGETQILGQVRQAYDASRQVGAAGPVLHPLFQRAMAVGKQVHSQTSLAEGRVSVASVAVDYAKRIFDTFSDKTVLSIGAGKMSLLVLRNLVDLKPKRLLICNRDHGKAATLAEQFDGEAVDLEKLADHLVSADIVVSGTGSEQALITRAMFEGVMRRRRYKPVFLIDIALPRDVEPSVGEADNVYLYNLDDLQKTAEASREQRGEATEAAGLIVAEHVRQFTAAERVRRLGPTIDRLYRRYHAWAQEELERAMPKLTNISANEKEQLQELVRRLVNKVLHDPVRTLRQSDALHGPTAQYIHAMEMLFQLKEEEGQKD